MQNLIQNQTATIAMSEIEAVSPIQDLIAQYSRLANTYEMQGNAAAAATCEILVIELTAALRAALELHRLTSH